MPVPWWLHWLFGDDTALPPVRPPQPLPPPRPTGGGAWAPGLIEAINEVRLGHGRPRLVGSGVLSDLAANWAAEIAARGTSSHGDWAGRIGPHFPGRPSAENVSEGWVMASQVVDDWMTSPPHRRNLLGPYTLAGCGKAADADGRLYWVCNLVG